MKCWECRKEISKGLKVQYWEGNSNKECKNIKIRKVCEECHSQLKRDTYGFVEVDKIIKRQLNLEVNKKRILERKTVKELVAIAESMNLPTTVSRAQYDKHTYYDHVLASKSLLIERIIKKRKW